LGIDTKREMNCFKHRLNNKGQLEMKKFVIMNLTFYKADVKLCFPEPISLVSFEPGRITVAVVLAGTSTL
jgi:hypothetical protein